MFKNNGYGTYLLKIENEEKRFEKYLDIEDEDLWRVLHNICNGFLGFLQYDYGMIEIKTPTNHVHLVLAPDSIRVIDQDHNKDYTVSDTNVIIFNGINIEKMIEDFVLEMNKSWKEIKSTCNHYTIEDDTEFSFDTTCRYPSQIVQEKLFLLKSMLERTRFGKLNECTVSLIYQEFFQKFQKRHYYDYY